MLKRFLPNNPFNAAINSNAPSASNPFATMADVIGINIVSVPNYSALPAPASAVNTYYRTLAGENTSWRPAWLGGTYYPEGIYFSDGLTWDFVGEFPYQATQVEVDAGVNDKNFVTPATFDQAAKWGTKYDASNPDDFQSLTEVQNLIAAAVLDEVINEIPSGLINGSNAIFTLASLPIPDTEEVFLNGLKQLKPQDYNILGQTITLINSPMVGENLVVNYKI